MTNPRKLLIALPLALLCGIVLKSAISRSSNPVASASPQQPPILVAQNDWKPPVTTIEPATLAQVAEAPPQGPKVVAGGHGKEVVDGKEVIPADGKETLPPVGQLLNGQRPGGLDPGNGDPATEFLNTKKSNPNNQLLTSPSVFNVAGPVVSPETR